MLHLPETCLRALDERSTLKRLSGRIVPVGTLSHSELGLKRYGRAEQ